MTTTVLTTNTAAIQTGSEHSNHNLLSSVPDVGNPEDGYGIHWVYDGDTKLAEFRGLVVDWGSVTDGVTIYSQFIDQAGNAGAIVSYEYSIDELFTTTYYIDPTNGDDGSAGTGTGASAKASWGSFWSTYTGSRSTNDKVQVLLKRGETFTTTGMSNSAWVQLSTYVGHLKVGTYGTGAQPHIDLPSDNGGGTTSGYQFIGGTAGGMSVTVHDIEVDGQNSDGTGGTNGAAFCQLPLDPVTGSTEAGLLFLGCTIGRVNGVCIGHGPDAATSYAFKNRADFVLMQGCTVDDYSGDLNPAPEGLFTGWATGAYIGFVANTILECGSANGFYRIHRHRYSSVLANTFDRSTSASGAPKANVIRIGGGGDTDSDDFAHDINVWGNLILEANEGVELEGVNSTDQWAFQDITVHGNIITIVEDYGFAGAAIAVGGGAGSSTTHSRRLTNIRVECNAVLGIYAVCAISAFEGSTSNVGKVESVIVAHNTNVLAYGQGTMFVSVATDMGGDSTAINDGAITCVGNYGWSAGSGFNSDPYSMYDPAWIGAADYNHVRQATAGGITWNGSGLSTWRSATSLDSNSTEGFTATHYLTDVTLADFDPTPTSSLHSAGMTGFAGAVVMDLYGKYFDAATPDAGAVQYDGSDPTPPDTGAPEPADTFPNKFSIGFSIGF